MARNRRLGGTAALWLWLPVPVFFAAAWVMAAALPGAGVFGGAVTAAVLTLAWCLSLWALGRLRRPWLLAVGAAGAALLLLRLHFFPVETSDYTDFLQPWTEWLRAGGGLAALGREQGNYNVPYLVFLALFSYLDCAPLYPIKLLSVVCDLVLAAALGRLILRVSGSGVRAALGYGLALALPTVFINGAVWGQCDSVYVCLAVLSLCLCLEGKPLLSMAAIALSFAFKLQAVFLMPVFLLLLFSGKLKWFHLPVFPAVYVLAVLPAVLAGRSLWDTLTFYVRSASTVGDALCYNAPSLFSLRYFYRADLPDWAGKAGILAAFLLCLAVFALFWFRRRRITDRALVYAALLLSCGLPLLLPHMHDRYFYLCDVLTLAAALIYPPAAPLALFSQFGSLLGYYAYFTRRFLLPMRYGFWPLALTAAAAALLSVRALALPPVKNGKDGSP